jgi:AcrR family transcriptional regulator
VAKVETRRVPSQERARITLDAVFEAALRELGRSDAGALNVNRIAETAGVSIGSIYQYFPSKDALLAALIARYMRRRFEAIAGMIRELEAEEQKSGRPTPLEEVMRRLIDGTIRLKQSRLPIETSLIAWFARVGSLQALTQLDREFTAIMADGLRTLQRPPARIRAVDPMLGARVLMQSIRATLLTTLLEDSSLLDQESLATELTELAVRYLRPDAPH